MIKLKRVIAGREITFIMHDRPHFEEDLAVWFVQEFADILFLDKYAPQGRLEIGVKKGCFDEHPDPENGQERKKKECSATLVAKALGINNAPALRVLLNYARFADLNKPFDRKYIRPEEHHHPLEPANTVKVLNERYPNNPERVLEMVIEAIIVPHYEAQLRFCLANEEFKQKAEIEEFQRGEQRIRVVSIVSDNPQMQKAARSNGMAVLIQKNSFGNVQIFTDKRYNLHLGDSARIIRFEEQKVRGKMDITDWYTLEAKGMVTNWYYSDGEMLLNGSLTNPDVEPTRLSFERIKE